MAKTKNRKLFDDVMYLSRTETIRVLCISKYEFHLRIRQKLKSKGAVKVEKFSKNAPRWYKETAVLEEKELIGNQETGALQDLTDKLDHETRIYMQSIRESPNHPRGRRGSDFEPPF